MSSGLWALPRITPRSIRATGPDERSGSPGCSGILCCPRRRLRAGIGNAAAVPRRNVGTGGDMDVAAWLKSLGLEQYAPAFADNDIDVAVLAQLTDADLKELGVTSLGHRKRLLTAVAARPALAASAPAPG